MDTQIEIIIESYTKKFPFDVVFFFTTKCWYLSCPEFIIKVTQKLKLMRKCGQFNTTIYRTPKKTRGGGGAILLYLLLSSIGLTHGSLGKEILNFYPARQSWLPGLGRLQTHHPEEEMNILQNIQE